MDIKLYFFENSTCALSSVARLVQVGRPEHKIEREVLRWLKTEFISFF